ncbi:S-layer homology domain-containing protein [Leptolyngbya sp. BC1307]|uniref:S-layer homology domain-containing protein n=1 Tax=Leptolyngbya sp. BC1307 TaxID=2029589 RepID=UPI000EFC1C25|nr:S-layer homology domain-containing protein [Leptolyngbya sp. BC1307]
MSVLYVSPAGQDSYDGTAKFPFRTLTQALRQASSGGVIQLGPGAYQAGEQFPLEVPAGVTVTGAAAETVTITGGGASGRSEVANVTVVLSDRAQLRGVTVTNPQGSGLLVAAGTALIIGNRLVSCQQYGVIVSGSAHPFISENAFIENGTGLAMVASAKGEVRQNRFERTDYGISLSGQSAPLVLGNQLAGGRYALVIAGSARPVLRQNRATRSEQTSLWVKDRAQPDIGLSQDLGQNWFEGKTYDIRNDTARPLATAGNQLNPIRVEGELVYLPSEIPDQAAVPDVLLGNVEPVPLPPAPPNGSDVESDRLTGISLDSRFDDLVGHWSAPFVEALAAKGLVKGFLDGSFQPDQQVTRAQFAALIVAAFPNAESIRPVRQFPDVLANFWAAQAIRQAQTQGFISGFPDGSFRPNAPLMRVQAVVALVNGLDIGSGRSQSLLVYSDRAQVPSYAVEPVAAATERQMVVGYPDPYRFRPLEPITRAETTALVHQALAANGRTARLPSPFITRANATSPNFGDLSAQHWANDFIEPLVQRGWLSGFGDGTFRPDAPITRAQFAALLVGALRPEAKRPALRFRDVPDNFWAAKVIQLAYRAKFLSGFPDLTFDPNSPLTKLQALLALVSGLNLQSVSPPNLRSLNFFTDRAAIPDYAAGAIASATQLGLVFNRPFLAELRPDRAATRAEVSAMVYQTLVIDGKMPAVPSPDQVALD